MKQSMRYFLFFILLTSILFSAEPSAFGAGDLTSSNPYGLTSNEKVILETKKTLHKVAVKSNNQANKLDSLRDRIDGLQSIIESLSRKAHNNKITLKKLLQRNQDVKLANDEYNKRVSEVMELNSQSIEEQKRIVSELTKLIDTINVQYISKNEFNTLVSDVNSFKVLMIKELQDISKTQLSKKKSSSITSADLYNQAKKNFDKKYYTKAIQNYELLIKRKYKPAFAHYMIGEMNYRRKNYANAVSYFKKSASLYTKAKYMPTLMLHTAISMQNTGDLEHAQAFLEAVLSKYPNSLEAEEANSYLQQ